jgi:hypothetical protein
MALLLLDGFDKYGALNATPAAYLTQEWTSVNGGGGTIVAGLSSSGSALNFNGSNANVQKNLGANYSRLLGGLRFSSPITLAAVGVTFYDIGTAQASVTINNTTGTLSVRNGGLTGTALGTSTASVAASSVHYLEWDITFANAGSYQLWLDGVSVLSGSGDTTGSANNYANLISIGAPGTGSWTVDDFYLFDTTGSANNAVLLTSPRVETQFPISDASVQFGIGAATLGVGGTVSRGTSIAGAPLNAVLYLRPVTASRACTLNSISFTPLFNNAAANYRVCVYADSAGVPGTLMGSSSTITGATSGTTITGTLGTPQSLTAGTQYWLGIITDVAGNSNIASFEVPAQGRYASNTFASGPPGTAPTMTTIAGASPLFWGSITSTGANYYEVGQNPASGNLSYVTDTTVGHEDLYSFPALSAIPAVVHGVIVKANVARSDSGARSVSVRMSSGGTDSGSASLTPGTTYGWLPAIFQTDPNTLTAWTGTNLNAATSGIKIDA